MILGLRAKILSLRVILMLNTLSPCLSAKHGAVMVSVVLLNVILLNIMTSSNIYKANIYIL